MADPTLDQIGAEAVAIANEIEQILAGRSTIAACVAIGVAERTRTVGAAPVALPFLAELYDGQCNRLLDALRDELPRALALGKGPEWVRAGHAIINLCAGYIDCRVQVDVGSCG